jgi:heme oxygenase (mycobilin-producing)
MIVRIVKMEFEPEKVNTFLDLFNATRNKIAHFDGCSQVDLLPCVDKPNLFFTYSIWESEEHLEKYRNSELFKQTWAQTKVLFCSKPEAWSLLQPGIRN